MHARFATATELADQTTTSMLERLAGLGAERRVPLVDRARRRGVQSVAVRPHRRGAHPALDGFPVYRVSDVTQDIHPLALVVARVAGYTAERPAGAGDRVSGPGPACGCSNAFPALDVEVVVADVPPFGWRRVHLAPAQATADAVDDGREIETAVAWCVAADADGTLHDHRSAAGRSPGLRALEDVGDRGDTLRLRPVPPVVERRTSCP